MNDDINDFVAVELTDDAQAYSDEIRNVFSEAWDRLDEVLTDGREKSLAKTNMQQASMWAQRSNALNQD